MGRSRSLLALTVLGTLMAGHWFNVPVWAQPSALSEAEVRELLDTHNRWRERNGVAPLHWSTDLADQAANWALVLKAEDCSPRHSPTELGENIFWASARIEMPGNRRSVQEVAPAQVVDSWGNESRWYDIETDQCRAPAGNSCGHFTQLIWSNTDSVGCGFAVCQSGDQVWICNYSPAGNVVGQRPIN